MKRILFLAFIIAALAAGIASASGDTLVIGYQYDATSFDPHVTSDIGSQNVMVQIYDPLMKVNENGELAPHLAESVEDLGNLTYKFTLRKGVKFHNGELLRASDVKFTFLRALNESQAINYVVSNIDPDGINIIDDYTFTIKIKKPDASFLAYMAHYGGACILNEKAVRDAGDNYGVNPVGTGPYKFTGWVKGDRITLERNDDYWGEKAKIKNIVIRPITEATNRTIELETEGVDLAFSIQPLDISRIEDNPKLKLLRNSDTGVYTIGMNMSRKPLDDIRVRRAISLAIDSGALNKAVYRGVGAAGRTVIPPTIPYYDETAPEHEYNPEKAKELLAEAGYADGLSLVMVSNENKERIDTMTIAQNMLKKVGIDSEIQVIEWGVYLDKLVQGEYDLCTGGWSCSIYDPDEAVYGQYHSSEIGDGYNWVRLSDAETDRLIEEGRENSDPAKRAEIYKALQRRINELYPVVVTQIGEELLGMRANLMGVSQNTLQLFDLSKAYFSD
ncbi:MAG: ABC transporter substrate-binding protein [Synergistaceae bacterium]|jgi:peptide/nickel transport system substrate-binding protein|nr:ABC transporter substrate-binding protein [Synergistaceae bacterium]